MAEKAGEKSLDADIQALREDLKSLTATVSEIGKAKSGEFKEQVGASVDDLVERGRVAAGTVQDTVKQRPVTSILMAFGIGMLIGHLFDRR